MRSFYILAAVLGTAIPWFFFADFFAQYGFDVMAFLGQLFGTNPAAGFTSDILISSFVFWIWAYQDARERQIGAWWVISPCNLLVGLSLALPLYFMMRHLKTSGK